MGVVAVGRGPVDEPTEARFRADPGGEAVGLARAGCEGAWLPLQLTEDQAAAAAAPYVPLTTIDDVYPERPDRPT